MMTSQSTAQSVRCEFGDFARRLDRLVHEVLIQPSAHGIPATVDAPETVFADAPLRCNACGRDLGQKARVELRAVGTIYDERGNEVHEYRDCPCGSTLLFILDNRRDESEFGRKRRALFDEWLERLVESTGRTRATLRPVLRALFRVAMNPHRIHRPRPLPEGEPVSGARESSEGLGRR